MRDATVLLSNGLLIASGTYCFIGGLIGDKKCASAGIIVFIAAGAVRIASEITNNNENVRKAQTHICLWAEVAGIDLILADVIMNGGMDKIWAIAAVIPPAIDLVMYYFIDSSWDFITQFTDLISIGVYVYFGVKESKGCMLIGSAIGFLMALYGGKRSTWTIPPFFFAFGIFCAGFHFGGKDLSEFGIGG